MMNKEKKKVYIEDPNFIMDIHMNTHHAYGNSIMNSIMDFDHGFHHEFHDDFEKHHDSKPSWFLKSFMKP